MIVPYKNIVLLILCFTFISDALIAQEEISKAPKNQIEFQHDNDFITLTDRYYSSGLFLTYRRRLNRGIFPLNTEQPTFNPIVEQLSFQLIQQVFTPSDLDAIDINMLDRPYAGFTGLETTWSFAKNDWLIAPKILIGFTGPSSGAGQFQRWFHDNVIKFADPTWVHEIADSFHFNTQLSVVKEWQLAPNPFGVHLALGSNVAYGTKDVYVEPEVVLYLGRRNPISSSIAYDQVGSTEREIYFTISVAHRFVTHNAFLQGNRNGDDSPYTIEPNKNVTLFGMDLYHRSKRNDYKFGYHSISKEAPGLMKHKYVSLGYARSF